MSQLSREMPLKDFYLECYQRLNPPKPGQAYNYWLICVNRFAEHLGRAPTVADLTEDTITGWMHATVEQGLSVFTANNRMRYLKAMARLAFRRKLLEDSPYLKKFKEPRRLPEAWSPKEMDRLIRAARAMPGALIGIPEGKWWPALLLLIYDTGLRRQAALGVRFDELDFEQKVLRVPACRMKNGVEQVFHLSDQTIEAILETVPPRRPRLFPWPFKHDRPLYKRLRHMLQAAGMKCGPRDLFHKIRRTTATQIAIKEGEHVALRQLGHLTLTTIKAYIDPRFLNDHKAALSLPRPGQAQPINLEIEIVREPCPAAPPATVTVRHWYEDLDGRGLDVLASLFNKPKLNDNDVRAALNALRVNHLELAKQMGFAPRTLLEVIDGTRPVSVKLNKRLKAAIGLTYRLALQISIHRAVQETKP